VYEINGSGEEGLSMPIAIRAVLRIFRRLLYKTRAVGSDGIFSLRYTGFLIRDRLRQFMTQNPMAGLGPN